MKKLPLISLIAFTACTSKPTESKVDTAVVKDTVATAIQTNTPKKNPNFSPVTAEVDADKDGKMSTAEWKKSGLPESSFKMFEAGRGYVTQEDYEKNAAPDGIDINGDGKLTVAEFKEFDRIMSEKMKNGEMPPPPPPPKK